MTCENHLILQGTHPALDRAAWVLETRIFPDADPFVIEIDDNVLYVHFWTDDPPIDEITHLSAAVKEALISFTYCDRDNNLIGEFEPVFGHRPDRTKSLDMKYQLELSA